MSIKQKLLAVFLTVVCLGIVFYTIFTYSDNNILPTELKTNNDYEYILDHPPIAKERYKIINIVYENKNVYAIVHLDNGNLKVIQINEAYIDPSLIDINTGFLYRENNQIYIKAE